MLLTAGEVYVRDLKLVVPSDCVAGLRKTDQQKGLALMREGFQAEIATRGYDRRVRPTAGKV